MDSSHFHGESLGGGGSGWGVPQTRQRSLKLAVMQFGHFHNIATCRPVGLVFAGGVCVVSLAVRARGVQRFVSDRDGRGCMSLDTGQKVATGGVFSLFISDRSLFILAPVLFQPHHYIARSTTFARPHAAALPLFPAGRRRLMVFA